MTLARTGKKGCRAPRLVCAPRGWFAAQRPPAGTKVVPLAAPPCSGRTDSGTLCAWASSAARGWRTRAPCRPGQYGIRIRHPRDGSCRRNKPRIGGQHAVDILENLDLRAEGRRERDRADVATAAAKRRDIANRGSTLEAGHDRNLAVLQRSQDSGSTAKNLCVAEVIVSDDPRLAACQRDGRVAGVRQQVGKQSRRDDLATRQQQVLCARVDVRTDIAGQLEQRVGRIRLAGATHRGRHHDHRVPGGARATNLVQNTGPPFRAA